MPKGWKPEREMAVSERFKTFIPSDSEEEDWGDDDREWPVEGIVEEDIDVFGRRQ